MRPDISIIGENSVRFVVQCRLYEDARIYFMSYLGDTAFSGELVLRGEGNLEIWDPERGERFGVNHFEVVERGVRLSAEFFSRRIPDLHCSQQRKRAHTSAGRTG